MNCKSNHRFIYSDGVCRECGVLATATPGLAEGYTIVPKERFFILTPTMTEQFDADSQGQMFPVYLDAEGLRMKWSGKGPLPQIGDRVLISMNSIGWGKVVGYWEARCYVGVLVDPENPPDWYKRQTAEHVKEHARAQRLGPEKAKLERVREWPKWIRDGIASVFGAELKFEVERKGLSNVSNKDRL